MGLGRINPGCKCGCVPRNVLTTPCQLAGQHYNPISVTLSTPVYAGVPLHNCGFTSWPTCGGSLQANPGQVTVPFLSYDHADFVCQAAAVSTNGYWTGSRPFPPQACFGIWKVYQDASSGVYLINSIPGGPAIVNPFTATATASVALVSNNPKRYSYGIAVSMSARLMIDGTWFNPSLGAWVTGQATGNNWYRTSTNFIPGQGYSSATYRSLDGKSSWSYELQVPIPGLTSFFPPWCGSQDHNYLTINSFTGLTVYSDDSLALNQIRDVLIWQPSPALDGLSLTTGAQAHIQLGV